MVALEGSGVHNLARSLGNALCRTKYTIMHVNLLLVLASTW